MLGTRVVSALLSPERRRSDAEKEDESGRNGTGDSKNKEIPPMPEESQSSSAEELIKGVAENKDYDLERGEHIAAAVLVTEPTQDANLVTWDGPDDINNPMNWSICYKWLLSIMFGSMTFCVTFASSVFSSAIQVTAELCNVSTEVTTLGVSLFVLGFGIGPLIWGPCSEMYGRKPPLFFAYAIFCIFQIPVALAQNIQTILVCRFIGGLFSAGPLAIVRGTLADFWDPVNRAVAVSVFAGATFAGPVAGPIVGGFVTKSYLGWRWTAWITLILSASFGILGFFIIPETYEPILLQAKAKQLRNETKNQSLHSKFDNTKIDPKTLVWGYLLRPFIMLSQEPILVLFTLYISVVFGILYLSLAAYPISFQVVRGWDEGAGALLFVGIFVGVVAGSCTISLITKTRFQRKYKKHGRVIPEERLTSMIMGAIILPIGLFWFAWTSSPHISWVPQVIASVPIGMGIMMIFLPGLNYIVDVYMRYANSALAANIFLRSTIGAAFPLFAPYMYRGIGVAWATSVLGFIAVALAPVPIIFYIWGARIRKTCRFYIPQCNESIHQDIDIETKTPQ